jgi:hypothetical protein
MAHAAGYIAIALFTLAAFVAVYGIIDMAIQLRHQKTSKKK